MHFHRVRPLRATINSPRLHGRAPGMHNIVRKSRVLFSRFSNKCCQGPSPSFPPCLRRRVFDFLEFTAVIHHVFWSLFFLSQHVTHRGDRDAGGCCRRPRPFGAVRERRPYRASPGDAGGEHGRPSRGEAEKAAAFFHLCDCCRLLCHLLVAYSSSGEGPRRGHCRRLVMI